MCAAISTAHNTKQTEFYPLELFFASLCFFYVATLQTSMWNAMLLLLQKYTSRNVIRPEMARKKGQMCDDQTRGISVLPTKRMESNRVCMVNYSLWHIISTSIAQTSELNDVRYKSLHAEYFI